MNGAGASVNDKEVLEVGCVAFSGAFGRALSSRQPGQQDMAAPRRAGAWPCHPFGDVPLEAPRWGWLLIFRPVCAKLVFSRGTGDQQAEEVCHEH